jgi:hypothetical protein
MTPLDLEELQPGDSIIGFGNRWTDELPVVAVGAMRYPKGYAPRRAISVRHGTSVLTGRVFAGGTEIRGVRGRVWSRH